MVTPCIAAGRMLWVLLEGDPKEHRAVWGRCCCALSPPWGSLPSWGWETLAFTIRSGKKLTCRRNSSAVPGWKPPNIIILPGLSVHWVWFGGFMPVVLAWRFNKPNNAAHQVINITQGEVLLAFKPLLRSKSFPRPINIGTGRTPGLNAALSVNRSVFSGTRTVSQEETNTFLQM